MPTWVPPLGDICMYCMYTYTVCILYVTFLALLLYPVCHIPGLNTVSCMSHCWLQHYWPLYLVFLSLESLIPVLCIVLFFPLYPTVSLCTTHCTPHSCPLHFLHCIPLYSTVFLLYVPNSCPLYHALLSSVFHINVGHSLSISHILSVYFATAVTSSNLYVYSMFGGPITAITV